MRIAGRRGTASAAASHDADDLVARARAGDEEAFRLIFDRYSRPVIGFLFDMVGRRDLAEELAQETFVRAYRGLGTMRGDAKLSTWLFGIAKNVARESLRARRRAERQVDIDDEGVVAISDDAPLQDTVMISKELNSLMKEALDALGEDKRLVFSLKVLQQKSYEEISEITGSTVAKLKTDLHRARAEMRQRIRPYLGGSHEV